VHKALCDFFSVSEHWQLDVELPQPSIDRITIKDTSLSSEEILGQVLCQSYDIEYDDQLLRSILLIPKKEQGSYFMRLRTGYRVRREFFNTIVEVPESLDEIGKTLQALGFKVTIYNEAKQR
jgi:hypothetical protein